LPVDGARLVGGERGLGAADQHQIASHLTPGSVVG
jgi:hypothetical protein